VLGRDGTAAVPRTALAVTDDKPRGAIWVVTVSLDRREVTGRTPVPGAQPPIMVDEWMANGEAIKAHPRFLAALARRGITDASQVQVDAWPASNFGLEIDQSGRRLARAEAR
jgi:primary-amine oxidase